MPLSHSLRPTIYTGTFIHTPSLGQLEVLENAVIAVDGRGIIRDVSREGQKLKDEYGDSETVRWEGKGRFWFPGFVDTHIHASQTPNTGLFGTSTLLSWLETYTYPLESSLSSPTLAAQVYNTCVSSTLRHSTTTACYYATISVASTNLLASICYEKGQRAFIGRVCMDCKETCPEYYRDKSPESALSDTKATIAYIDKLDPKYELITPILTPRFAPSCNPPLLSSLGALAKEKDLPIQTHISENTSEIALVKKLFPSYPSYAAVYDAYSLLTPRTVLAHGIYLTADERNLIIQRRSKVSHCPVSNTALSSGICPVRTLLDEDIEVGLGTDVSGGYSPSILVAAREAAMVSRILASFTNEPKSTDRNRLKLSVPETLYLATLGGATCLGLKSRIGTFAIGKEFDAQTIDLGTPVADLSIPTSQETTKDESPVFTTDDTASTHAKNQNPAFGTGAGNVQLWGKESWGEQLEKWVFCGDDRNTRKVWCRGRVVHVS